MGVPEDLGWLEIRRGDTELSPTPDFKEGLSLVLGGGNFEGDRRGWPLSPSGFIPSPALQSPALESTPAGNWLVVSASLVSGTHPASLDLADVSDALRWPHEEHTWELAAFSQGHSHRLFLQLCGPCRTLLKSLIPGRDWKGPCT